MIDGNARDALQYIEKLEEMFATEGWKLLIEEAKAQIYQYQSDALQCPTWDSVCELRGQVVQLSRLVNLEDVTELLKAQAEQQILSEAADEE